MAAKFSVGEAAGSVWPLVQFHRGFVWRFVVAMTIASIVMQIAFIAAGFSGLMASFASLTNPTPAALQRVLEGASVNTGLLAAALVVTTLVGIVVLGMTNRKLVRRIDPTGPYLGLSWGASENALLIATLKLMAASFAAGMVLSALVAVLAKFAPVLATLLALVAAIAVIYISVRITLWPFFAEAMIGDKRDPILAAFAATKGHFWPLLGTILLVVLMVILVSLFVDPVINILAGLLGAKSTQPTELAQLLNVGEVVRLVLVSAFGALAGLATLSARAFIFHKLAPDLAQSAPASVDVRA